MGKCKTASHRSSISLLLFVGLIAEKIPELMMAESDFLKIVEQHRANDSCFTYPIYFKAASPFPKHNYLPTNHSAASVPPATHSL
jgi:hypothetical protein